MISAGVITKRKKGIRVRADVKALHMHLRKDIVPSDQRWGLITRRLEV